MLSNHDIEMCCKKDVSKRRERSRYHPTAIAADSHHQTKNAITVSCLLLNMCMSVCYRNYRHQLILLEPYLVDFLYIMF